MRIPAVCGACGLIFPSGFNIENSVDITLTNNTQSCPKCGAMANVLDGTFDVRDELLRVVEAPWATFQALRQIQALIRDVASARLTKDQAIKKASETDPRNGETLKFWLSLAPIYLSVLISALALFLTWRAGMPEEISGTELRSGVKISAQQMMVQDHSAPTLLEIAPKNKQKVTSYRPPHEAGAKNRKTRLAERSERRRKARNPRKPGNLK